MGAPNQAKAAHPIKLENRWDYQNGYPHDYQSPLYCLDIPTNPFPVPKQVSGNFSTAPWIITQGHLSDSTYLPEVFKLNLYFDESYIQVSVEASYGIEYHKIPKMVSPYFIDCMLIYVFENNDIKENNNMLSIGNKEYRASDLVSYRIYADSNITAYNVISLVSEHSFEDMLDKFISSPPQDYKEGMPNGFVYDYDKIIKYKEYLIENIPLNIKQISSDNANNGPHDNPNTGRYC